MAASPLTAALMGGNGGETASMFGMDPNLIAAQPDIQLGQSLMQGGLSTAPASPWQALARVVQAGTGSYIQHSAISDLAKAYAGSSENMAKVFDGIAPDGIMSKGLRSPDPVVRQQFMQAGQKAILQLNEAQKLGPAQTLQQPGGPALATNTGAQSPEGKVAADIQHAQTTNPAAVVPLGRALTLGTTKDGYAPPPSGIPSGPPAMGASPGVPSGPPRVTSPVMPTAAVPPPVPQKPARSILPGGAQIMAGGPALQGGPPSAPPATFNQQAGLLPGYAGAQASVAGAKAGAEETAKNNANLGSLTQPQGPLQPGPGTTEPIKTAAGTMIPALKEQGPIPTNPAQLKEAIPAWQAKETAWNASLQPAQQAEQRLNTIASAFKEIETGKWTTEKANFAQTLKAVGINPANLNLTDPTAVQLALHENYVETLQQLKATTPRFTQAEFKGLSANKESPDQPPGANLQMLSEDIGTLRQARDLPADFTAAKANGWQNPQSFESAWLKANPLSGYVDKVKGEIGPLKGMPGFQGATKPGAYVWNPNGGITPK